MKKVNILIGIPTPERVHVVFALDNLPLIIAYTKKNLKNLGNLFITHQTGIRTDRNRNIILRRVIEQKKVDYILWLDSDMLYPIDIICKYMQVKFDVMGCLYFKKPPPHDPVVYIRNKTSATKPFAALHPSGIKENTIYTVDGIGFGGMMVNMKVYEALGRKKWMHYGKNFHLPYDAKDRLTHDLQFCEDVQKAGFKIALHGSVRAGHITDTAIDEEMFNIRQGKLAKANVEVIVKDKKKK